MDKRRLELTANMIKKLSLKEIFNLTKDSNIACNLQAAQALREKIKYEKA